MDVPTYTSPFQMAQAGGMGGSSASGSYTGPSPYSIPGAPDWLKQSGGAAVAPLQNELANTDKFYDVSKYLRAMKNSAQSQFATDLQQGQNAASEQLARSYQNGTYGSQNSSMIAAQTALPGQQKLLDTKTMAAQIALKAQEDNQQARASIAKSIADARTQYSSTLANYITQVRGQNIQGYNNAQSLNIQGQQANTQQQALWVSLLSNKDASPSARAWAQQNLGIAPYNAGYTGNFGQQPESATGYPGSVAMTYAA